MNSVDELNIFPDIVPVPSVIVGVVIGFACLCVLYGLVNSGKLFHKASNRTWFNSWITHRFDNQEEWSFMVPE